VSHSLAFRPRGAGEGVYVVRMPKWRQCSAPIVPMSSGVIERPNARKPVSLAEDRLQSVCTIRNGARAERARLEVEAGAEHHDVLFEAVAAEAGVFVVEELVFEEGAHFFREVVVGAGDQLPGEAAVAVVADMEMAAADADFDVVGLGGVAADARADVRLEAVLAVEADEEVGEVGAAVEVAVGVDVGVAAVDAHIHVGLDAVVVEVGFHGGANVGRAEDVAELDAAREADFVIGVDGDIAPAEGELAGAKILEGVDAGLHAEVPAAAVNGLGRGDDGLVGGDGALAGEAGAGQNGRGGEGEENRLFHQCGVVGQ
jgi:hypothetical protein